MNKQEVAIELVEYRTSDIEYASTKFIKTFAHYSGLIGTDIWTRGLFHLRDKINNQKPQSLVFAADEIAIEFSGFKSPTPRIINEQVVYVANEPRFTVLDVYNSEWLLPSQRTIVEKVVSAINQEMKEVYHLREEANPTSLVFPKTEYASSISVYQAPILSH